MRSMIEVRAGKGDSLLDVLGEVAHRAAEQLIHGLAKQLALERIADIGASAAPEAVAEVVGLACDLPQDVCVRELHVARARDDDAVPGATRLDVLVADPHAHVGRLVSRPSWVSSARSIVRPTGSVAFTSSLPERSMGSTATVANTQTAPKFGVFALGGS